MIKKNVVKDKSFDFAVRIVNLYKYLTDKKREFVLSKQLLLLCSGTAIGALIRESEHAESKADFIHKLSISLKEANETNQPWVEPEVTLKFDVLYEDQELLLISKFRNKADNCVFSTHPTSTD